MTTATVPGTPVFRPDALRDLPVPAAAYLTHAIEPGTPLLNGARLTMHGHIKVGTWLPFTAEETIDRDSCFRWSVRVAGGLFSGTDELCGSWASSRFGLFGTVPVVRTDGSDVWRSALGRFFAEQAAWLPGSLLPDTGTRWHVDPRGRAVASVPHDGGYARIALGVAPDGRLRDVSLSRWGRDAGRYGWIPFGMVAIGERTFGGFTVPSAGRVGWWYGTPRWRHGEFFRFALDGYEPF